MQTHRSRGPRLLRPARPRSLPLLASLVLVLASGGESHADEVVLNGGTRLQGTVLQEGEAQVRLLTSGGDVLVVARSDVKAIERDAQAPKAGQFLRYVEPTEKAAGGLDVATTWYEHPSGGPRIALVGAVHIAEKSYYRDLMKLLEQSDVVLYEGVKAKDTDAEAFQAKQTEAMNPVRDLQTKMAKWFGLSYQLDEIEYTRPHFVHADATPAELGLGTGETPPAAKDERDEGEDAAGEEESKPAAPAGPGGDLMKQLEMFGPMLENMLSKPGPVQKRFKRMFARMLGAPNIDKMMGQAMPGMSELLLTRRNEIVMERLAEQKKAAKAKSIAIFYGAAHNGDLEKRLIEEMGYRRAGAKWFRAWHLEP